MLTISRRFSCSENYAVVFFETQKVATLGWCERRFFGVLQNSFVYFDFGHFSKMKSENIPTILFVFFLPEKIVNP